MVRHATTSERPSLRTSYRTWLCPKLLSA